MADHRGILNPAEGFEHFRLDRQPPAPDLAPFVEQHWVVAWDLRGRAPYTSEVLPYPSFHVVVEDGVAFAHHRDEGVEDAGARLVLPDFGRAARGGMLGHDARLNGCTKSVKRPLTQKVP